MRGSSPLAPPQVASGELAADGVDEAALERQLVVNRGLPEPELVLQLCPELLLGGLLPWQCSVTQYSHLGTLRGVTQTKLNRVRRRPTPPRPRRRPAPPPGTCPPLHGQSPSRAATSRRR